MSDHPAFPSSAHLAREADAGVRDVTDLPRCATCVASSATPSPAPAASTPSGIPTAAGPPLTSSRRSRSNWLTSTIRPR